MNYFKGIIKCISFIEDNLDEAIHVQEVVAQEFYSYPHMHRVFTSIVGETMSVYIRKRRLTRAGEDLLMTQETIIDIAIKYQFSSQQTFTRAFKEYFHESPRKFRENGRLITLYDRFQVNDEFLSTIHPVEISIEKLPAFQVMSYHKIVNNIKEETRDKQYNRLISEVWNKLIMFQMSYEYMKKYGPNKSLPKKSELGKFMLENRLHTKDHTQYFGFTNPYPYAEHEFGYEAWVKLINPDETALSYLESDEVVIKQFEGGLYITAYASMENESDLNQTWRYLHYWMTQHKEYRYGNHPWLEEHLTVIEEGGFHGFKLYLPVIRCVSVQEID